MLLLNLSILQKLDPRREHLYDCCPALRFIVFGFVSDCCVCHLLTGFENPSFFSKKPNPLGFIGLCWVYQVMVGFLRGFLSEWLLLKVKQKRLIKLAGFLVVRWKPEL